MIQNKYDGYILGACEADCVILQSSAGGIFHAPTDLLGGAATIGDRAIWTSRSDWTVSEVAVIDRQPFLQEPQVPAHAGVYHG